MKWKGKINFDARPQYATDGLITSAEVDTISGSLQINIDGKSDIAHFHDDRYYTESEVDDLITTVSGKLDDHNEMNNLDYVSSGHIGFASSDTLSMASAVELTIVSGTVTCTQTLHRIDTEGDIATDDLDTIIGGTDGDIIIVRAENGTRTVVLKDGTGNLKLGGRDLELIDTNMAVMLFYSGVLDQWLLIGDGGGSATAAVSDDAFSSAWDGGTAVAPSRNAVYDIMVTKSDLSHLHDDRYYTESEVDTISGALNTKIDGKSDTDHIHDSRYYTETELNEGQLDNRYYTESETDTISGSLQTNIDGKSDIAHFHDDRYYIESEVDTISGSLSSEIDSDISTHTSNSDAHHNESHNVASHSDTTATGDNLNELVGGGDTILHKHDTLYYTESEVDTISGSLNTSKSDVGHSHTESDITDLDKYTEAEINTISGSLQTAIDGKSDIGHIHDSRYYTESEVDTISGSLNTKLDTHKSADDHTNYLLIDGTRAMTDNLDMDSYSINNINVTNLKAISCTVHNATGSTLTAGTCVYPNGVSGGVVTVAKCDVTDKDKMPCLGIISVNIANGTAGKAVTRGIKSMDTSGFSGSVYDRVYVQADGSIDTTEPTSGSVQRIGILTVKDVSGQIYIHTRGRKSIVAAANEHPEMRMGNDAGHQKVCFLDYTNNEVAGFDNNGNLTVSGTVDTVDVAVFKSDYDSHEHDDRYYTETEVDTISGSLNTKIEGKSDTTHLHDDRYYLESEVDTISGSLSAEIDSDISTHTSNADAHHAQSHNIASHSDTDSTGVQLNELVGSGDTILHKHDTLYYTESETDTISGSLNTKIDGKSDTSHLHDDRYYTESEVDTVSGSLNTAKSDVGHSHTESDISDLDKYTQAEVDDLITTVSGKLDDHNELNNLDYASSGHTGFQPAGDYTTDSELTTLSGALKNDIDGKSDIGHFHDDRYYTESEVDTISGTLQTDIDTRAVSGGAEHDGFSDFVANEHVDHSGVSITAGTGLTGGGNITATRTLDVDVGITDDKIVQMDDLDAADNDYCKLTASGIEGRNYSEVLGDIGAPSVTTVAWSKSIGSGGDYATWAAMIADMPDLIAHAVIVTIKAGTTLTETCDLKNKHGLTSAAVITIQAEKYFPTSGAIPTADSATATTLRDAALASAVLGNDYFNGCWVFIVHGTGTDNGFVPITDYVDATGDVVVASWPGTQPDNTSRYLIVGALIECGGTIDCGFVFNNTSVNTYLYGIGMHDAGLFGAYMLGCSRTSLTRCGAYNCDREGMQSTYSKYTYIRYCGVVKCNTDNSSSSGGIQGVQQGYLSVRECGLSDNKQRGIFAQYDNMAYSFDNFGDLNGTWGSYALRSGQINIAGTECSGSSGNHSDPGTAGTANADQASAY